MDCREQKSALRKEVLARRDEIPPADRARKSSEICRRLLAETGPLAGKTVAVYLAMRSEVRLDEFIAEACRAGARVCFPCMMALAEEDVRRVHPKQRSHMVFREVAPEHCLANRVPFSENPMLAHQEDSALLEGYGLVEVEELDVIVVPMVAFNRAFDRMGYGGGNYDGLLREARPDARIVGVAFEEQCVDEIPCEAHDHPLPLIISA